MPFSSSRSSPPAPNAVINSSLGISSSDAKALASISRGSIPCDDAGRSEAIPEFTIDVDGLANFLRVQLVMGQFVRRKSLAIWMVKGVDADDADAIFYVGHAKLFERSVLEHDVLRLDDALDGDWRILDCEIADDGLRDASRLVGVGSHDPAFLLPR